MTSGLRADSQQGPSPGEALDRQLVTARRPFGICARGADLERRVDRVEGVLHSLYVDPLSLGILWNVVVPHHDADQEWHGGTRLREVDFVVASVAEAHGHVVRRAVGVAPERLGEGGLWVGGHLDDARDVGPAVCRVPGHVLAEHTKPAADNGGVGDVQTVLVEPVDEGVALLDDHAFGPLEDGVRVGQVAEVELFLGCRGVHVVPPDEGDVGRLSLAKRVLTAKEL